MGAALVPHYSQLASAMCVFRSRQLLLWLPPPHCVPPTGAFDGALRCGSIHQPLPCGHCCCCWPPARQR